MLWGKAHTIVWNMCKNERMVQKSGHVHAKKAIFNAQPWNDARIVYLLRDSIANQLKQRKEIQLPKINSEMNR